MNKDLIFTDGSKLPISNIYCIGKNYAMHAKELGSDVPDSPLVFLKPNMAYIRNKDLIKLPEISKNVHYEAELVIVIGQEVPANITENQWEYVAGIGVGVDVTMRDLQRDAKELGHPWTLAKGFRTSCPISDIVPMEKISHMEKNIFDLELYLNDKLRQSASTSEMVWSVEELISYLSKYFDLYPGDVIFTGTPAGVGHLEKGDHLLARLKGLISLENTVE